MKCLITKLKQYVDIVKRSITANRYIRDGIDYGFDSPGIKIIFDNKTYQFELKKISRSKSVHIYNFYNHLLKRKRFAIVYSPYKDLLKMESLTKKKQIQQYWRLYYKTNNKNNKDYIHKEIYFNKSRLVSKIKKKNDNENIIFLIYRSKIYPFKLEITEPYIAKFSDATDKRNSYKFLFDILFSSPTSAKSLCLLEIKTFLFQGILSVFR